MSSPSRTGMIGPRVFRGSGGSVACLSILQARVNRNIAFPSAREDRSAALTPARHSLFEDAYAILTGCFFALFGLIWGGLVRIFFVHHVTWSVNSICHLWGRKPYDCHDESRNNFVVGILGLGEGWHNNHHAFPRSARHGFRWWQIDVSYWVILVLSWFRLAWNVKQPSTTN